VTSRGNRRGTIFVTDIDARVFLSILSRTVERHAWKILAYCLMPNHFHLVVGTPRPTLSSGMQHLKGTYARYFNEVHGYDGHVFQGRFASQLVENDWHLFEVGRYVALNPVRSGLVPSPERWEWSSYAATIGIARSPQFLDAAELLSHFARDRATAIDRFRRFVSEGAGV